MVLSINQSSKQSINQSINQLIDQPSYYAITWYHFFQSCERLNVYFVLCVQKVLIAQCFHRTLSNEQDLRRLADPGNVRKEDGHHQATSDGDAQHPAKCAGLFDLCTIKVILVCMLML